MFNLNIPLYINNSDKIKTKIGSSLTIIFICSTFFIIIYSIYTFVEKDRYSISEIPAPLNLNIVNSELPKFILELNPNQSFFIKGYSYDPQYNAYADEIINFSTTSFLNSSGSFNKQKIAECTDSELQTYFNTKLVADINNNNNNNNNQIPWVKKQNFYYFCFYFESLSKLNDFKKFEMCVEDIEDRSNRSRAYFNFNLFDKDKLNYSKYLLEIDYVNNYLTQIIAEFGSYDIDKSWFTSSYEYFYAIDIQEELINNESNLDIKTCNDNSNKKMHSYAFYLDILNYKKVIITSDKIPQMLANMMGYIDLLSLIIMFLSYLVCEYTLIVNIYYYLLTQSEKNTILEYWNSLNDNKYKYDISYLNKTISFKNYFLYYIGCGSTDFKRLQKLIYNKTSITNIVINKLNKKDKSLISLKRKPTINENDKIEFEEDEPLIKNKTMLIDRFDMLSENKSVSYNQKDSYSNNISSIFSIIAFVLISYLAYLLTVDLITMSNPRIDIRLIDNREYNNYIIENSNSLNLRFIVKISTSEYQLNKSMHFLKYYNGNYYLAKLKSCSYEDYIDYKIAMSYNEKYADNTDYIIMCIDISDMSKLMLLESNRITDLNKINDNIQYDNWPKLYMNYCGNPINNDILDNVLSNNNNTSSLFNKDNSLTNEDIKKYLNCTLFFDNDSKSKSYPDIKYNVVLISQYIDFKNDLTADKADLIQKSTDYIYFRNSADLKNNTLYYSNSIAFNFNYYILYEDKKIFYSDDDQSDFAHSVKFTSYNNNLNLVGKFPSTFQFILENNSFEFKRSYKNVIDIITNNDVLITLIFLVFGFFHYIIVSYYFKLDFYNYISKLLDKNNNNNNNEDITSNNNQKNKLLKKFTIVKKKTTMNDNRKITLYSYIINKYKICYYFNKLFCLLCNNKRKNRLSRTNTYIGAYNNVFNNKKNRGYSYDSSSSSKKVDKNNNNNEKSINPTNIELSETNADDNFVESNVLDNNINNSLSLAFILSNEEDISNNSNCIELKDINDKNFKESSININNIMPKKISKINFIDKLDIISQTNNFFTINNNRTYRNIYGGSLTLMCTAIICYIFYNMFYDLISKNNPNYYTYFINFKNYNETLYNNLDTKVNVISAFNSTDDRVYNDYFSLPFMFHINKNLIKHINFTSVIDFKAKKCSEDNLSYFYEYISNNKYNDNYNSNETIKINKDVYEYYCGNLADYNDNLFARKGNVKFLFGFSNEEFKKALVSSFALTNTM